MLTKNFCFAISSYQQACEVIKYCHKNKILPKIKNLKKIEERMDKVDNIQLRNSLNQFLKAYNERNK